MSPALSVELVELPPAPTKLWLAAELLLATIIDMNLSPMSLQMPKSAISQSTANSCRDREGPKEAMAANEPCMMRA